MSKYTTQLRWVVEQACADAGVSPEPANWPTAYAKLGLASSGNILGLAPYPVYQEAARATVNDAIIRRYWMNEIGAETAARFAWNLNDALSLVMPYYNQLWEMKVLDAAHLVGEDFKETLKLIEHVNGTASGSGNSSSSSTSNTIDRALDTPQARIQNLDDGWLTSASKGEATGSDTAQSESQSETATDHDRTEEREHDRIDPSMYKQLLTIGRDLLNIPRMIVDDDEVRSCFMLVW